MLDLWIIEDLKRREQQRKDDRPVVELPLWPPLEEQEREVREEEGEPRGAVVVDYRL